MKKGAWVNVIQLLFHAALPADQSQRLLRSGSLYALSAVQRRIRTAPVWLYTECKAGESLPARRIRRGASVSRSLRQSGCLPPAGAALQLSSQAQKTLLGSAASTCADSVLQTEGFALRLPENESFGSNSGQSSASPQKNKGRLCRLASMAGKVGV